MTNKNLVLLVLVIILAFLLVPVGMRAEAEKHVYYGYVPPSTDMGNLDELINGRVYNYTPPSGTALLDVVGTEDNTEVEVWDIITKEIITKFTVGRLEKKTVFIPFGTYFKVVSSKRVLAMLSGGDQYVIRGTSCFYPSIEGGFRGREFIIIPATVFDSYFTGVRCGYNALILGIKGGSFKIVDSSGEWSLSASIKQHEVKRYLLWCRIEHGEWIRGAGNSMIFELKGDADIMIAAVNSESFVIVPAVSGGFVGKLFFVPTCYSYDMYEGIAVMMIIPQEACKVEIYDSKTMRKVAEKTFSERDAAQDAYWFYKIGKVREKEFIVKSTGRILVITGCAGNRAAIPWIHIAPGPHTLGPDVSFMGLRPGERVKVFVPTLGIVFAPETLRVIVDGKEHTLKEDEFLLLDPGMHTIESEKVVIIEVISTRGEVPRNWGAYLLEPRDIIVSYKVPSGFGERPGGFGIMYIVVPALIVALAIVGFLYYRRRRTRR